MARDDLGTVTRGTRMHTNFYTDICYKCRAVVEARTGYYEKTPDGKGRVFHKEGQCDPAGELLAPDAPQAPMGAPMELDYSKVAELIQEAVAARVAPQEVHITVGEAPKVAFDQAHAILPEILRVLAAGIQPFLVGPAGSGKTTLAKQCAKALGVQFYMANRVTSSFDLIGFINAAGTYTRTQFRDAYEHGGVFLFDEADASDPDAFTALNAALAGEHAAFPDGLVERHAKFYAIAAGNTYGRGADRQYVGRNQLDAATLDRFPVFEMDYDEQLELRLAGNDDWTRYVQAVRHAIAQEKVRHIVSTRASIYGAKLLAAGMDRQDVEESCIWKGLDEQQRTRIVARVER